MYYLSFLHSSQPHCSVYHSCTTHIGICMLLGTTLHRRIPQNPKELKKLVSCTIAYFLQVFVAVSMVARLNISTLYSRRKHLDALFRINVFKNKISCSSVFDTVSLLIPTRIIRDFCSFVVKHNFKVSPSAICVSAASAICKESDILNKDRITLIDIT
jgi:membrane-associated HD superfamily phosphohydrolase